MDDSEVRSKLFIATLGVGGRNMIVVQKKAYGELPGDVARLGFSPFRGDQKGPGARKIASGGDSNWETGVAWPAPLSSHQFARRSDGAGPLNPRIRKGLSRRHCGVEDKQEGGRDISCFTISIVLREQ